MKVKDVLARKGSGVTTIRPSASITELLGVLAEHRIGAAVVVEGDAVAGSSKDSWAITWHQWQAE